MLLSEFIRSGQERLSGLYPPQEASNIISILCRERLGIASYVPVTCPGYEIPSRSLALLEDDLQRLSRSEPLQYVLGKSPFWGREFNVCPSVLVPRPETEILVELALKREWTRALDLCTGSGCIAWTLKLERPQSEVVGLDISEDALKVAAAQPFSPAPSFVRGNVLAAPSIRGGFDLIVSNPPYIMEREKALMRANVLDFEPSIALFVPDEDPLVFYRALSSWCRVLLGEGGCGIVEINENLARQTASVFSSFRNVRIEKDLCGKSRFVTFEK